MIRALSALAFLSLVPLAPLVESARAPSADQAAIEAAVTDYVEALYRVEPARIERSVHPALTKIGLYRPDDSRDYRLPGVMTYDQLRSLAGSWNADGVQGEGLTYEVEVLDALDVTASAKLTAKWGVDYMHLVKTDGGWKIHQILWQSHPPKD